MNKENRLIYFSKETPGAPEKRERAPEKKEDAPKSLEDQVKEKHQALIRVKSKLVEEFFMPEYEKLRNPQNLEKIQAGLAGNKEALSEALKNFPALVDFINDQINPEKRQKAAKLLGLNEKAKASEVMDAILKKAIDLKLEDQTKILADKLEAKLRATKEHQDYTKSNAALQALKAADKAIKEPDKAPEPAKEKPKETLAQKQLREYKESFTNLGIDVSFEDDGTAFLLRGLDFKIFKQDDFIRVSFGGKLEGMKIPLSGPKSFTKIEFRTIDGTTPNQETIWQGTYHRKDGSKLVRQMKGHLGMGYRYEYPEGHDKKTYQVGIMTKEKDEKPQMLDPKAPEPKKAGAPAPDRAPKPDEDVPEDPKTELEKLTMQQVERMSKVIKEIFGDKVKIELYDEDLNVSTNTKPFKSIANIMWAGKKDAFWVKTAAEVSIADNSKLRFKKPLPEKDAIQALKTLIEESGIPKAAEKVAKKPTLKEFTASLKEQVPVLEIDEKTAEKLLKLGVKITNLKIQNPKRKIFVDKDGKELFKVHFNCGGVCKDAVSKVKLSAGEGNTWTARLDYKDGSGYTEYKMDETKQVSDKRFTYKTKPEPVERQPSLKEYQESFKGLPFSVEMNAEMAELLQGIDFKITKGEKGPKYQRYHLYMNGIKFGTDLATGGSDGTKKVSFQMIDKGQKRWRAISHNADGTKDILAFQGTALLLKDHVEAPNPASEKVVKDIGAGLKGMSEFQKVAPFEWGGRKGYKFVLEGKSGSVRLLSAAKDKVSLIVMIDGGVHYSTLSGKTAQEALNKALTGAKLSIAKKVAPAPRPAPKLEPAPKAPEIVAENADHKEFIEELVTRLERLYSDHLSVKITKGPDGKYSAEVKSKPEGEILGKFDQGNRSGKDLGAALIHFRYEVRMELAKPFAEKIANKMPDEIKLPAYKGNILGAYKVGALRRALVKAFSPAAKALGINIENESGVLALDNWVIDMRKHINRSNIRQGATIKLFPGAKIKLAEDLALYNLRKVLNTPKAS